MPSRTFPRKPLPILQHAGTGCVTCIVGQVLYVFGLTDRPDLHEIDRAAGRKRGQPLYDSDAYFYLVQRGFSLYEYTTDDVEAFLRDGITYLRLVYGNEWTEEHTQHFTPRQVAHLQRKARADLERRRPYTRQMREVKRDATVTDIAQMLRRGWVVDVTLNVGRQRVQHAGLIVPRQDHPDGSRVWLYVPEFAGETVFDRRLSDLAKHIRFTNHSVTGLYR